MQTQADQQYQNIIIRYLKTLNHIKKKPKPTGGLLCIKKYL